MIENYTIGLRNKIAENKIIEVLSELIFFLQKLDTDLSNQTIIQLSRFNKNEMDYNLGLIDYEQYTLIRNRLNHSVLEILNQISTIPNLLQKIAPFFKDLQSKDNIFIFTVSLSPITKRFQDNIIIEMDKYQNVYDFLTEIYMLIKDFVSPNSYSTKWILTNTINNENFYIDLIDKSVNNRLTTLKSITLEKFGIKAGMQLETKIIY